MVTPSPYPILRYAPHFRQQLKVGVRVRHEAACVAVILVVTRQNLSAVVQRK